VTVSHRRTAAIVAAAVVLLAACSGPGGGSRGSPATPTTPPQVEAGASASSPSALDDRFDPRLPEPLVDPAGVRSGGPPPDGIPPIDQPSFERADTVRWLEPNEPVLSLTVEGETRAYPLRIMTWHEIVNDTVGGVPVAVTYCPLCSSGVAFLREVDGRLLSFGTSGMLYADNLVMYDRQTESLWPQLTGRASIGVLTGALLEAVPMGTVAWRELRATHPRALVLSQDTGFDRPYGSNPYVGYDNPDGDLLFELPDSDERLPVKERVVGLEGGAAALAVVRAGLADRSPVELEVGRRVVTLWHRPGLASALDTPGIATGRDIGTVAAFAPVVEGRRLHFTGGDGLLVRDEETGSRWNILGRAVAGPLQGARLAPYRHLDTFWFAWAAFHPDTDLVDPRDPR
jgi:hypothetical protein